MNRVTGRKHHSVNYLDELFRSHPYLDHRDRALISNLTQGVLRWRLRLDYAIDQFSDLPFIKIDRRLINILRLALYQILFLDRIPESAAVNEAVNQARANKRTLHTSTFVNGLLRNACRHKDRIIFPDRDRDSTGYLSVYYSYPRWLVEKWISELGEDATENLLFAQNRLPGLNIRANTLKISREELMARLIKDGMHAERLFCAPDGVVLENFRGRISGLSAFKEGLFQVQYEAAQLTSLLLGPRPGDTVLDVCAGFGGKSTHMAGLMEGRGRIFALDIDASKLVSLGRNAGRLGISCVFPVQADASVPLSSLFKREFDRIMVDAPCTGLGVLSRHPDGKWNRNEKDTDRLAGLQKIILARAASVLRKGGEMLYVTCTVSRQENEGVVEDFLKGHGEFHLVDLKGRVPEQCANLINQKGFFQTLPHVHNMDGFFAALFRKA